MSFRGGYEFNQGDTLKGRVIKEDSQSNKVTIKLTNGMEIEAELQGEVDLKGGLLNFEVAELKDNMLFLKLTANNTEVINEEIAKESIDEIMNFILKEGLKKEDYNMLKAMVKYNIPLTRENITTVKSIMEFSDKMNNNPVEIKNFINSYLNSRDIAANSKEGVYVSQKLYEFFEAFSKTNLQEVLLFLENDIEFTKENLESFNKLFNNENAMEKVINEVNEKLGNAIAIEDNTLNREILEKTLKQEYSKDVIDYKNNSNNDINDMKEVKDIKNINDIKDIKDITDNNINNSSILSKSSTGKTIQATLIKESSKDNIINDGAKSDFFMEDDVKEIIKVLKNENKSMVNENKSELNINKEVLRESILKHTGKEVRLNDAEAKLLEVIINKDEIKDKEINFIKNLFNSVESRQKGEEKELKSNDIRENIFSISKDLSKNITEKSEGAKEVIRNIISNLKESDENSSQILNIMKNSINDLKLFNKINDQYYCLDVPINFKENEYPCKLIIKDDRKEGKSIDSSNFKVAISVKTVKLGTVDALLNVKNRNIDLQLKCDKSVMNLFVISKEKLKEIVESSGFSTKIEIVERTEELQLSSCREFFNDNNIAAVDITV
ncbi:MULTISPECIES: hypothetical protein [Clostridia]|uniref:Flagellar hook-length control protein FliK n=2 Tax=Clostridia TaxID=186801 RepID=A0A8I0A441_9CLOT|nr:MULTISPECIES: hypothetical protein [Clostridia]MBC5639044.1 hypothetical protein [Clostridium lentum]MBC5653137.1 hypothetical protein [Blautia lenta]